MRHHFPLSLPLSLCLSVFPFLFNGALAWGAETTPTGVTHTHTDHTLHTLYCMPQRIEPNTHTHTHVHTHRGGSGKTAALPKFCLSVCDDESGW